MNNHDLVRSTKLSTLYWKKKIAASNKAHTFEKQKISNLSATVNTTELSYFYKLTNKSVLAQYTVLQAIYVFLLKKMLQDFDGHIVSSEIPSDLSEKPVLVFLSHAIDLRKTFKEHLQKIKEEIVETSQHAECIGAVIKDLNENGLNQFSNYSMQFNSSLKPECNGLLFEVNLNEQDRIEIQLSFLESFVKKEVITCLISCFVNCLTNLEAVIPVKLCEYSLLSETERLQLIVNFNSTQADYPENDSITSLFEKQAAKTPENSAVVFEGKVLSYKELNERANQFAAAISSAYKINKGDIVGVLLPKSDEIIISFLAILKLGGVYLPIDINYPKERIDYILQDSKLAILLVDKTEANYSSCTVLNIHSLDYKTASGENIQVPVKSNELAYIIYTSGSTGDPKGVMIEHRSAVNMAVAQIRSFKINSADRIAWFASVSFDASISEILMNLYSGAALYIPQIEIIKDTKKFTAFLKETKLTVVTFPPSYLDVLPVKEIMGLRCVITAGEPANPLKAQELVQQGIDYYNAYGPTECAVCTTIHQVGLGDAEVRNLSIGKPISNTQVYILNEDMEVLPVGVIGKLYVSGAGLARGYLNKATLTSEKFVPNPFQMGTRMYDTGDLACWLSDGTIEFAGRKDHQVKIRGYRIELGEIETKMLSYSRHLKQVVVEPKENNKEKILVAYWVSAVQIDKMKLRLFLQQKLPEFMVPHFFIELKKLPITPNGKIDRKALPEISSEDVIRKEYVAPSTKTEKELATIWKEVLGLEKVGITDNFFELGGHSLMIGQVINRIHKKLAKEISFKTFFANPTILFLSKELKEGIFSKISKAQKATAYPLTPSQSRLWVLSQLEGGSVAYNMPAIVQLNGAVDVTKFNEAFKKLIARHEILRTVFKTNEEGELKQYVLPDKGVDFKIEEKDYSDEQYTKETIDAYLQAKNKEAFNLETGPLIKASLFKLSNTAYLFFLSMHHIIGDGWSIQLLITEIVKIYNVLMKDEEVKLPRLGIQYKDYAVWLNERLTQQEREAAEQYWLKQFSGELPVLSLPSFKVRPLVKSYAGNSLTHHFSKNFLKQLKDFSTEKQATLFMTLMAGINALLFRYSGQKDIIIGTPVAGREHPDLENQLGLYLNTLAIRTQLNDNISFSDLLENQKETLIDAYEHQSYSFDLLVKKLNLKRDTSRSALFDVLVILQSQDQLNNFNEETFNQLQVSDYDFSSGTSQFDMSFIFSEKEDLALTIQYDTSIYDVYLIERVFDHFENLLKQSITQPDIQIQAIDYLGSTEKEVLLKAFNNTRCDYPKDKTLVDLFDEQVKLTPLHTALIFEENILTYKELNEQSNQLADYLRKNHELAGNELVGIKLERNENLVVAMLAVLKCGAAYVPIDVAYPQERITYIEQDSRCKVIVDAQLLAQLSKESEQYSKDSGGRIAKPTDLAYLIYTSGTTGQPKGVMIEHRNAVEMVHWSQTEFAATNFEVMYAATSFCFDLSVYEIFYTLSTGKTIRILKNALEIKKYIGKDQQIGINTVPSVVRKLQEDDIDFKNVSFINMAGEALPVDLIKKLPFEKIQIRNLYGPSEDTTYSTNYLIKTCDYRSILIGKPISNTQVYLLDDALQPVPVGVSGKLYMAGAGLSRGYLNKPDLTAEKFIDNPFENNVLMYDTGDLACWLPDGNIEYLGRKDDQVKVRGYRIELGEIENALIQYSTTLKQAVVSVKENKGEKVLVAYLVSTDKIDKSALRSFLQTKMPEYMIPGFYIDLEKLPLSPNGKIDRRALPTISEEDLIRKEFVAPRNESEEKLVEIWKEVLGIEKVGITDNFFELGGHSLIAAQVINRAQKQLNKTIAFKTFFVNPTIETISEQLKETDYVAIPKAAKSLSYPLTASQKRLWLLSQLEGGSVAYNMPAAVTLKGFIDTNKFEESFQQLIQRHEILRTRFKITEEGEIHQYIESAAQLSFKIEKEDLSAIEHPEGVLEDYLQKKNNELFDLEKTPLIKASLIKIKEDVTIFFLTQHHIIADGWSVQLMFSEVVKIYKALTQQQKVILPELTIQYKDYAAWMNTSIQQQKQKDSEFYWLQQFEGELPVLDLPSFKTRPLIQTFNGNKITQHFSDRFLKNLKAFSKQKDVTLFMTLMAAINSLLHKYTRQDDIIIGTPIVGREHPDLENQIGLYLNTLAIRTKLNKENSFLDLLEIQKQALLNAYEHQGYPFDTLIDKLNLKRDTSRSVLFDVLVVLQNQRQLKNIQSESLTDLQVSNYEFNSTTSQFDISFTFVETDGLDLTIEYNTDIYDVYLIKRMFTHFENLIAQVIDRPGIAIKQIDYLTPEEQQQVLLTFNATEDKYPENKTVIDLFEEQVKKTPAANAVVFEQKTLTYKELDEVTNQLAAYLKDKYIIQPDDMIGVKLERNEKLIVAIVAVLKAGAAYVPIDTNYPKERIDYMEQDSNSKVIIDEKELNYFYSVQKQYSVKKIKRNLNMHNLVYLIYTSGSTGIPKGIMMEHLSMFNLVVFHNKQFSAGDTQKVSQFTSISFDVSFQELFTTLTRGATLYPVPETVKVDSKGFSNFIKQNNIDTVFLPTSYFKVLMDVSDFCALIESCSIKHIIVAGEQLKLSREAIKKLIASETILHNHYGPAETHVVTTLTLQEKDMVSNPSIGVPIANNQIYILDETLKPVPIGVIGKLYISGTGVARGYLNKPELTKEKFFTSPFKNGERMYDTGDLSRWLPDGTIEFMGRNDHQVKIRGYRIELGEIENVVLQYTPDLSQAIVEAQEVNGDKTLVTYFVASSSIDKGQLRKFLQERLPEYMVPGFYIPLESIPLTHNGKINRRALPAVSSDDLIRKEYIAPRNNVEEKLVAIWQEVLNVEKIGITDNFFELGGHSLIVAQVINSVQKQLNKTISFKMFFANPVIEDLSSQLQEIEYLPIPPIAIAESYPLTPSQTRLWILSQLEGGSLAYNIPIAIRLSGTIDIEKFEQSFAALFARYEILRTYFKTNTEGELRQYIVPAEQFNFAIEKQYFTATDDQEKEIAAYITNKCTQVFNLEQAPLVNASLIKINEQEHVFLFCLHHIIGDGWSLEIIVAEIVKVYNALLEGKEGNIQAPVIQYKDCVAWLHSSLHAEKYKAAEAYWLKQFSGELPVLDLPGFKTRPLIQTYTGDHATHYFSQSFLEKVKGFSTKHQATLFMTLMAGINALLHRYTGQDDIIIGTPVAGREHPDLENQLGLFLNTLAIRTQLKKSGSFLELLETQRENLLAAYQHQHYPFDALIGQLNLKRDTSRSALFDVLVILQNQQQLKNINTEELNKLQITPFDFKGKTSKFDIGFTFIEGNGLELIIEYNTDIYDEYLIKRMFDHFENLILQAIDQPTTALQNINYLTAAEQKQLLEGFNTTVAHYEKDNTVIELFEAQVAKTPTKIAVVFEDKQLTFQELNEQANQLAAYLRVTYSIKADDVIGVKLARSEKLLITMLGVLKSGAAYIPIDPTYPQERIAYIEKNSSSKVIIDNSIAERFDELFENFATTNLEKINKPGDLAYIIYTSGTTGNPKGVMVEHGNLSNFLSGMNGSISMNENDHLLAITSVSFDISILELFWTLTKGIAITLKSDNTSLNNFDLFLKDHSIALDFSFFYFSSQDNTATNKYQFLKESAMFADRNNFSAVWLPERHFHEFGGIFPNPSVLAAGLSTITNTIQIRSGSVVLPLHDTVRVAEEWSVVDNLSNGRVALSIASGWHADDFILQPDNYSNRQKIMYTQIDELKALWKGDSVKRVNGVKQEIDVRVFPRPVNSNLEIYITSGGNSETFRSAGKIGANILTHMLGQELKDLGNNIRIYKQALLENGFAVEDSKIALMLHTYIGTDLEEVKSKAKEPFKSYLRSSLGLIQNLAKALEKDMATISEADLNDLLDIAFERYWQTAALLGTPASCQKILADIHAIGVTEIACLIDFGIADTDVINGLDHLASLKNKYTKTVKKDVSTASSVAPITAIQITPSYLETLLEDDTSQAFIKSLQTLLVGGENFSNTLLTKLRTQTNATDIYNMYGPTETTIWSTFQKANYDSKLNIGKPIQNTQIYILDDNSQICPVGVKGELCIGGDGVSRGYYKEEKLTADKFICLEGIEERIYKTGDLARWLPDGTLEHLGRTDSQVKINGFRIELGEIESVLLRHERIQQAVVIARESATGAKNLAAYYVATEKIKSADLKKIIEQTLPVYMIPGYFIQLEALPLTPNGKIDRKQLPAFEQIETEREYMAPKNQIETKLVDIWSNVLNLDTDKIGIKDNFFELGGNSLLMIKMLNNLNKEFKSTISLLEGYKLTNIAALSNHIQSIDEEGSKEKADDKIEELYNVMEESYNLLNLIENEE